MELRQETRFESDQEVTVTLLDGADSGFTGRILNVSGRGMCLAVDRALPPGGAVKLELADALLLGEVIYCRELAGSFQTGLALQEALYHTAELAALLERLAPTKPAAVTSRR